ncbi:N-acetyl-gamma-glutamyl-phosphate reductase [Canibacter zhoujuaniae]|uniref:N-acetyl-gamma-glutamyl-phosphate reductase n=1 Tax=Canibacter zhoujuaniae TaxID=2708343 RepID=UPI001420F747|nr:N-acetyl-gamma-glutamyl-phosphate reductase [Canibacter zhoujuaniae]
MSYRVAVAGASGYAGGELLRLLAGHPDFEVVTVAGHSSAGDLLGQHQPQLRSLAHLRLQKISAEVLDGHDIVFFALPHGASGAITAKLKNTQLVVDCGADHRLENAADWQEYYGSEFAGTWAYGVPELIIDAAHGTRQREVLARELTEGRGRIAAPGCNASTVALSLAPGFAAGVLAEDADIVTALAVGPSGAGKTLKPHLLAAEMLGSASPYAVGGSHRHIPEILQSLRKAGASERVTLSFTPMLVPMARGILATSTAKLCAGVTADAVRAAWENAYADEPFVHVLPAGVEPRVADTIGANTCVMSVAVDEKAKRVVVVAALDNLAKGTAGAAVQSANIALGLPEAAGLTMNGIAP